MDQIDSKLIMLLQQNARVSLKELAKEVFLTTPAVSAASKTGKMKESSPDTVRKQSHKARLSHYSLCQPGITADTEKRVLSFY